MRLRRSQLAVPATSPKMIRQAAASDADEVFLDLEDSVAPSKKEEARANVIEGLKTLDWSGKTVSVRINGLESSLAYKEIVEIVEEAGDRLGTIMVPKVARPEDLYFVEMLLCQIERRMGLSRRIGIEALIETAEGLVNVERIACASRRLEALIFGAGDFSASIGVPSLAIGAQPLGYSGHLWHFPMMRIVTAARAAGLQAIDGPYGAYQDLEGLRAAASTARALGFDGKWAVHPVQIEVVHEVFTPTEEEVSRARAFAERFKSLSDRQGAGVMTLGGQMVDEASMKMAEVVLRRAEMAEEARKMAFASQ